MDKGWGADRYMWVSPQMSRRRRRRRTVGCMKFVRLRMTIVEVVGLEKEWQTALYLTAKFYH